MKSISKIFSEKCFAKYDSFGFSRSKTVFARIIGDVIQTFSLKTYQTGYLCTVEFGIFPLCQPGPLFLEAGSYELEDFCKEPMRWEYNPKSEDSKYICIKSIIDIIDSDLLPLFNACIDCGASLQELIEIEKVFEQNRQERLHILQTVDCAKPWQERSLFDEKKFYMALKSHNFSYVHRYLTHQIKYHSKVLDDLDAPGSPKQPPIVRERLAARLALELERIKRLNAGDIAYFDRQLYLNEAETIGILKEKYPGVLKTGDGSVS